MQPKGSLPKLKIGFISFIPDLGHIIPLLRIANSCKKAGIDTVCYLPEENLKFTKNYDLSITSIGTVKHNTDKSVFSRLSSRSIFYNAFSSYSELKKGYFIPIQLAVGKKLEMIKSVTKKDQLSVLICDDDIFNPWYKRLSTYLQIPLLHHYSEGSCRSRMSPFFSAFGIGSIFAMKRITIEVTGWMFSKLHHLLGSLRNRNKLKQIKLLLDASLPPDLPNKYSSSYISTGLAFFEKELLKSYFHSTSKDERIFPPIPSNNSTTIKISLKKWLDESIHKPVVYISFGTIIQGHKEFFQSIIEGISSLNVNVLWSIPEDQQYLMKQINLAPSIRMESFLPQLAILMHSNVKCFITHGGAGSIQESLQAGKPLLCIPFIFDQPYNSSIIAMLKVGLALSRKEITPLAIKKNLSSLLYNDSYRRKAKYFQQKIMTYRDCSELLKFVLEQIHQ